MKDDTFELTPKGMEIATSLKASADQRFGEASGSGIYAETPLDTNVAAVRRKMVIRAERGLSKYGVTTERDDLDTLQWLQHAQDEAMDLAVYLERLMSDIRARVDSPNNPVRHEGAQPRSCL